MIGRKLPNLAPAWPEWHEIGAGGGGGGPGCRAPCKLAPFMSMRGGLFPGIWDRPKLAQIEPKMQHSLPKMLEIAPK